MVVPAEIELRHSASACHCFSECPNRQSKRARPAVDRFAGANHQANVASPYRLISSEIQSSTGGLLMGGNLG